MHPDQEQGEADRSPDTQILHIEPRAKPLEYLEQLAIAEGALPLRTSPQELDELGLEGKDCPCAPR